MALSVNDHKARHKELHRSLDELCADYVTHTGKLLSKTSVMDLIVWSNHQQYNPTPDKE